MCVMYKIFYKHAYNLQIIITCISVILYKYFNSGIKRLIYNMFKLIVSQLLYRKLKKKHIRKLELYLR